MAKKKFQIFVSSTYTDLKNERQSAVETILSSGHIPAGMELFKAGSSSQMDTIQKWINESDIYMLILGGRYGSIEPVSGKSYTELEYNYAINKGLPIFTVILSDSFLHSKAANEVDIFEIENKKHYNDFKNLVMTKMIKSVNDLKDIKIAIYESVSEITEENSLLIGWSRGDKVLNNIKLENKIADLIKENKELKENNNNLVKNEDITYSKYIDPIELAEGNDEISLDLIISGSDGYDNGYNYTITWDEIIKYIGTILLTFKSSEEIKKQLQLVMAEEITINDEDIIDVKIKQNSFDLIKIQLCALRLITNKIEKNIEYFKYTEQGIKYMFDLMLAKR